MKDLNISLDRITQDTIMNCLDTDQSTNIRRKNSNLPLTSSILDHMVLTKVSKLVSYEKHKKKLEKKSTIGRRIKSFGSQCIYHKQF